MSRWRVHVTRHFTRNLDAIELFLREQEVEGSFGDLLERLFDEVIPNLRRFPRMGRDFLAHRPASVEGAERRRRLRERIGEASEIREYIAGDYILLYAVRGEAIYLLSIKHHRQLSFDFLGEWS